MKVNSHRLVYVMINFVKRSCRVILIYEVDSLLMLSRMRLMCVNLHEREFCEAEFCYVKVITRH